MGFPGGNRGKKRKKKRTKNLPTNAGDTRDAS